LLLYYVTLLESDVASRIFVCHHLAGLMIHLEVILPVQKMDQEGQKRNQPRHVYSSPCEPETCVILAFAIFLILRSELW